MPKHSNFENLPVYRKQFHVDKLNFETQVRRREYVYATSGTFANGQV